MRSTRVFEKLFLVKLVKNKSEFSCDSAFPSGWGMILKPSTVTGGTNAIFLIGAFPPPVHGMSSVNAAVYGHLTALGSKPIRIDMASPTLNRAWHARLYKIRRVAAGLMSFMKSMFHAKRGVLYMGLSGGYGQAFELPFVVLARTFGLRIYLHHHSYAYLNTPHTIAGMLFRIAGRKTCHIALCEDMAQRLKRSYKAVDNVVVISNAVFINESRERSHLHRTVLKTIGFLGNISYDKGILEFLDIAGKLGSEHLMVRALIAGPFQSDEVKTRVLERIDTLSNVTYVGPRYDGDKLSFYDSIDALLFPTRYINEAEPLTIHEAMSNGIPVIARGRGCISDMIGSPAGLVVGPDDDFAARALQQLTLWRSSPEAYRDAVRHSSTQFLAVRASYTEAFKQLCAGMTSRTEEQGPRTC